MRKLQLGEFKNTDELHLFAGSFLRHQEIFFQKNLECYQPVVLTRAERIKLHYAALAIIKKFLPILAQRFNEKNHLNYSLRFWHTFLSFWLASLIPNILEKYFKIESFIRDNTGPFNVELLQPEGPVFFKDDFNFNNNVFNDQNFNHYLSSLIFEIKKESLEKKGWTFEHKKMPLVFNEDNKTAPYLIPTGNIEHVTGMGKWQVAFLNFLSRFRSRRNWPATDKYTTFSSDEIIPPLPWQKILIELCPDTSSHIAPSFIEAELPLKRNFYIFSGFHYPIQKRFIVACARESGIPIYISQHGSSYGEPLCSTLAFIAQYTVDGFISWGWSEHEHHKANIIPWPSPVLSKMKIRRFFTKKNKNKKIVFISSVYTANAGGGISLDCDHARDTYSTLHSLLNEFSPEVRNALHYRPRPTHLNSRFNFFPLLQKNFHDLKELKGNFDSVIADADLVIQFHDGSTLNKVIAAGIPTITLRSPNHLPLNNYLESKNRYAEDHNISFSDPIKAASYINRIYPNLRAELKDNPKRWDFYRKHYCRTSFFYFFYWARLLFKL